jgi:NADH-quinone oxidoreductase subunit D
METPLNFGPQHPSTHGVLHLNMVVDGEMVKSCEPDVGFIHRGLEKIAENRMYFKFTPIANKIDYIAAASWENCYISCVERLLGMEIPERAKYARVIILELQRVMSHLFWIGTLGMDLGQPTIFVWALREREKMLDLFEEIMGGRMTFGWMIIGGLRDDLTVEQVGRIKETVAYLEERLPEYYSLTEDNQIFRKRLKGIGIISRNEAVGYGITGPNARASGVEYDVRKDDPYLIYDKLDFKIVTRKAGDNWARYEVRRDEMFESLKMVKQALAALPEGPFRAMNAVTLKPPIALSMRTPVNGEAFMRNECPRGEGMIYIRSDGSNFPYRLKIKGPSFNNLAIVSKLCKDQNIADVVSILATLDPVFGECDR